MEVDAFRAWLQRAEQGACTTAGSSASIARRVRSLRGTPPRPLEWPIWPSRRPIEVRSTWSSGGTASWTSATWRSRRTPPRRRVGRSRRLSLANASHAGRHRRVGPAHLMPGLRVNTTPVLGIARPSWLHGRRRGPAAASSRRHRERDVNQGARSMTDGITLNASRTGRQTGSRFSIPTSWRASAASSPTGHPDRRRGQARRRPRLQVRRGGADRRLAEGKDSGRVRLRTATS